MAADEGDARAGRAGGGQNRLGLVDASCAGKRREKRQSIRAGRIADKPAAGASPKNSTRLFIGMVMNSPEEFGGANDVTKVNLAIQPNSNVVRVAASGS